MLDSLVAGRLDAVGEQVDQAWPGRCTVAGTGEAGGFAERAVAAVVDLFPVPDDPVLPEATAFHSDGSTALGLVENAGTAAGEWVLVEAAAGGAGSLLVQLARAAAARVVGAAGGSRKLDLARELGAEVVVGYTQPGWNEEVLHATGGSGADVRPAPAVRSSPRSR
ncbi:zinc-binding dehydrogenase [Amycolatopsis thermoflava]|uniref:zinc-binding dehydrogenase n=1 Tax=Amycolatopsis thermoflava TaxID=84480 RepID=UPI003660835F